MIKVEHIEEGWYFIELADVELDMLTRISKEGNQSSDSMLARMLDACLRTDDNNIFLRVRAYELERENG